MAQPNITYWVIRFLSVVAAIMFHDTSHDMGWGEDTLSLLVNLEGGGTPAACRGPGLKKEWNCWTVVTVTGSEAFSDNIEELEAVIIAIKFFKYLWNSNFI